MNDCIVYNNEQQRTKAGLLVNSVELESKRPPHSLPNMAPQYLEGQNFTNSLFSNAQGTSNSLLNYQNPPFTGLFSSPGLNSSLTGYENNLQWVTDSRLSNQHNQMSGNSIGEKNVNMTSVHSIPSTTSHSCCVNRFNIPDSLNSPLPADHIKSACDVPNFQNKTNLTMSMIDPMQSWLNFQIQPQLPNNQQYCKYNEKSMTQNYNIPVSLASQINLTVLNQSDLKQSDICLQSPDACFENVNSNKDSNNVKHNLFPTEAKGMVHDQPNVLRKQVTTPQTGLIAKDWKTPFQTIPNYISSPNVVNTTTVENQDNLLFTHYRHPVPSAKLFYTTENFSPFVSNNVPFANLPQTKHVQTNSERMACEQSITGFDQSDGQLQNLKSNSEGIQYNLKSTLNQSGDGLPPISTSIGHIRTSYNYTNTFSDCCQVQCQGNSSNKQADNNASATKVNNGSNNIDHNKSTSTVDAVPLLAPQSLEVKAQNNKRNFRISEAETSESEESNIIVEESDDIGEIESEISIEEIKKTYESGESEKVLLRCLICNTSSSPQTPANQFTHMNNSFPLTSASKIPVQTKLEQILTVNLQHFLKVHSSFVCRRCLNLVESVEVLEIKLKTATKTLSDSFSRTLEQTLPKVDELLGLQTASNKSTLMLLPEHGQQTHEENATEHDLLKSNVHENYDQNESSDGVCHQVEKAVSNEDKCTEFNDIGDNEEANKFKCSYCFKVLSSKTNLSLHLQQHTKNFKYYCERCGKGFPLKSSLETHLKWHTGESREKGQVLCDGCGEIFSTKHIFKAHYVREHSGTFEFECDVCKKGFTRKLSLEVHTCKHRNVDRFVCEYCGRTFTTSSNLKTHTPICVKDLPFKCDRCEKSFPSETLLSRHVLQHDNVYKLSCSVCDKGFNKPSDLKYHMLSHSDEKNYKCENCDKAFKTQGSLNYHYKVIHKEEKVFTCSICGRNFGKQSLLIAHMNLHTNEKPYQCRDCDKCFAHQTTYISHLKTHSSPAKVKICQECGKPIKTRMSVHMRFHTGERPYKCSSCPLAFAVSSSLKKHLLAKHSKT